MNRILWDNTLYPESCFSKCKCRQKDQIDKRHESDENLADFNLSGVVGKLAVLPFGAKLIEIRWV